jgi:cyclic-di-AMP phosphodiesterase PgpH
MEIQQKYRDLLEILKEPDLKKNLFVRFLMGIFVLLFFTFLFPSAESIEGSAIIGAVWTQKELIAPFSFPIYKDMRRYEKETAEAATKVYPVIERRPYVETASLESLKAQLDLVGIVSDSHKQWLKTHSTTDSLKFISLAKTINVASGINWNFVDRWRLNENKANGSFHKIDQALRTILADVYRAGILDSGLLRKDYPKFALRQGNVEEIVNSDRVNGMLEARDLLQTRLTRYFGESDSLRLALSIGRMVIMPNLIFNDRETQRQIFVAKDNVPRTLGYVQAGERIIGKNERITEESKLKLDSFRKAKSEEGSNIDRTGQRLGILFHVLLIVGLFSTYLFLFRKKIFHDNAALGLLTVLIVLEGLFAYLTRLLDTPAPVQYLIFVPAASMLIAIIFDSRVAFYGTVAIALLVAGIRGNDYAIALASIIAGSLGAYTVRDVKNRTQIFRSLGFIFLGYTLSIFALGLERFEDWQTMGIEIAFAFGNALISTILTYALLIFFERVFKITTDLRLVELADFNQPLLERMSEEAPGTFHHSLMLGNLAEAAADEIGANSILAKVGAYYHDVGKLIKPDYFVENQVGTPNRHAKLKPRMSAKIIISHVMEGMELARAYNIPEKVVDFIPQHHGTGRLSFFFDKALRQAASRKNIKEDVNEEDYRYPGPKPQSKETAIVMLADTVEARTRTISEVTPQTLETMIDNLLKQRLIEGELEECDLTMRDLHKIKDAFLQILIGIHHHRIKYPDQENVMDVAVESEQMQTTPQPIQPGSAEPITEPMENAITPQEGISGVQSDVPGENTPSSGQAENRDASTE